MWGLRPHWPPPPGRPLRSVRGGVARGCLKVLIQSFRRSSAECPYEPLCRLVASHQAVEKALKALHLHHGQQSWGHGLGRSFRDLPAFVSEPLAARVPDLEDRLRVLDALYIPTRYPDSLPEGAPTDHFGRLQSSDAITHASALVDAIRVAMANS
ncbi:HEPN domain-containing protein [Synechococcus sp. RS9917]|uniref:HEPN domain-containing protein n=1 Tax=Synechococcus sp. RS9917 TaxID=221360 RepID=UPI003529A0CE